MFDGLAMQNLIPMYYKAHKRSHRWYDGHQCLQEEAELWLAVETNSYSPVKIGEQEVVEWRNSGAGLRTNFDVCLEVGQLVPTCEEVRPREKRGAEREHCRHTRDGYISKMII
jgi:hypothetical protein